MGRLLGSHPARRHRRLPAGLVERDHRGVEARHLERRVEDAVEELLELDRASEVAQEPVAPALSLRPLQRLRQVAPEVVHPRAHLVDRLNQPVVTRRWRAPTAEQDRAGDTEAQESRRSDDQADRRSARDSRSPNLPRIAI